MLATIVLLQPVPVDWPGYVLEVVPLAVVSVACLAVAVLGFSLRIGDSGGRPKTAAVMVAFAGFVAWVVALIGVLVGLADAPALAAAQTLAMIGTALIGIMLVRADDEPLGAIVLTAPVLLVVPSTLGWLAFGTMWTVAGLIALVQRASGIGPAGIAR
jgi:hypothetical protein